MDTDAINDLKDFIELKIDNSAREVKDELRQEIQKSGSEIMTAIGEVLDTINTTRDAQFEDHERRITKLERRTRHLKRPAVS